MPDQNGVTEIKDFSKPMTPHPFRVDPDVFHLIPTIPLGLVGEVARAIKTVRSEDGVPNLEGMLQVFDVLLLDEDAARLRERFVSKTEPIDQEQIRDILYWALETFGLRPTPASSDSSTGSASEDASITSTDGPAPTDAETGSIGQPGEASTSSMPTSES